MFIGFLLSWIPEKLNETPMSPCSGELMPVVVRNFQILSSFISFGAVPALFFLALAGVPDGQACAQDSTTPAAEAPTQTAPDSAPAPAPDSAAAPAATPAVVDNAQQYVLNQQKLTRSIREIRSPLPGPDRAAADKVKRQYTQLLATGFSGEADSKIVRDYLTWLIFQATDPAFSQSSKNMENLIEDVKNSIVKAGSGAQGGQAGKDRERRKYCSEVLAVVKQMLDNNLDSRFAAIKIMQHLYDTIPAQGGGATSMTRLHPEALTVMLTVLNDANQPDSVKSVTAASLKNILMNCDVVEQDQFRISDAIYKEIVRPFTEVAFQMDLIDAAYLITKPRRTVGTPEPTALKIFAAVINDRTKPVEVRCHAAKGFGICNYDVAGTKFEPIAWKVTQLAFDAASEYSQDPGNPKWQWCGIDLLLTFRHATAAGAAAAPPATQGIMNRAPNAKVISDAAPFVTTVSLKLISNKGNFSAQEIAVLAKMKTWLSENVPADLKWDTNAAPLQK
jgi:hypothetical protein